MKNKTIIAFDFGTLSIGAAIGQDIIAIANPLMTIKIKNGEPEWLKIKKMLQIWQPNLAVIGLPLNMDGTEQPITKKARNFAKKLHHRFNIQIKLHDERLTTIEAKAQLFDRGGYKALNKDNIDSISAVIILESWLTQYVY